jgi:hypothetical protein
MRPLHVVMLLSLFAGTVSAAAAEGEAEFKAAIAAAEAAHSEAGKLKNQWTTTAQQIAAAKQAAASGNFEQATNSARQAEALAKASISQAKEQEEAWKAAVIR